MKTSAIIFFPSLSFFPFFPGGRQDGSEKNKVELEWDGARHPSLCTATPPAAPCHFSRGCLILIFLLSAVLSHFSRSGRRGRMNGRSRSKSSGTVAGLGGAGARGGTARVISCHLAGKDKWRVSLRSLPDLSCLFYAETQGPVPDEAVTPHQRRGGLRGLVRSQETDTFLQTDLAYHTDTSTPQAFSQNIPFPLHIPLPLTSTHTTMLGNHPPLNPPHIYAPSPLMALLCPDIPHTSNSFLHHRLLPSPSSLPLPLSP